MRFVNLLLLSCASLFFLHCLSIDKKIADAGCFPQKKDAAEISVGYSVPAEPHRILGEITIQYGAGYERAQILDRLRREAAQCGADGILLGSFSHVDNTWKWTDQARKDSFNAPSYRLTVTLYRFEN